MRDPNFEVALLRTFVNDMGPMFLCLINQVVLDDVAHEFQVGRRICAPRPIFVNLVFTLTGDRGRSHPYLSGWS